MPITKKKTNKNNKNELHCNQDRYYGSIELWFHEHYELLTFKKIIGRANIPPTQQTLTSILFKHSCFQEKCLIFVLQEI